MVTFLSVIRPAASPLSDYHAYMDALGRHLHSTSRRFISCIYTSKERSSHRSMHSGDVIIFRLTYRAFLGFIYATFQFFLLVYFSRKKELEKKGQSVIKLVSIYLPFCMEGRTTEWIEEGLDCRFGKLSVANVVVLRCVIMPRGLHESQSQYNSDSLKQRT